MTQFTAEYLDKVFAPCGQQEIWYSNAFEVLVGVAGMEYSALKAVVQLSLPCVSHGTAGTLEA